MRGEAREEARSKMDRDDMPSGASNVTAVVPVPRGKMLKRAEAARMLGISVSTLRRREGDLVNPIVGPDGVHLFDESEVRSVVVTTRRRQTIAAMGPSGGEVAADVFAALDEGEHPVEIVKRLRYSPDVVVALRDQWAQMRGGFVVEADDADMLASLTHSPRPLDGASLVSVVRDRPTAPAARPSAAGCHRCGARTECLCSTCVVKSRGPLSTDGAELEHRATETSAPEVRVVARVVWSDAWGDGPERVTVLRSQWYRDDVAPRSEIADFVRALQTDASRADGT